MIFLSERFSKSFRSRVQDGKIMNNKFERELTKEVSQYYPDRKVVCEKSMYDEISKSTSSACWVSPKQFEILGIKVECVFMVCANYRLPVIFGYKEI